MLPAANGSPRSLHMYLFQEYLRYDKMAERIGARDEYVQTPEELCAALKRSYQSAAKENVSTLIDVQALKGVHRRLKFAPGIALPQDPGIGSFAH
jgi:thiamine pyrophosphate-dependent acetolactate synthase large subunit-like protein